MSNENKNRIQVLNWRRHGEDESYCVTLPFGADDSGDVQAIIEAEHGVHSGDETEDEDTYYVNDDFDLVDGQVLKDKQGRGFVISITPEAALAPNPEPAPLHTVTASLEGLRVAIYTDRCIRYVFHYDSSTWQPIMRTGLPEPGTPEYACLVDGINPTDALEILGAIRAAKPARQYMTELQPAKMAASARLYNLPDALDLAGQLQEAKASTTAALYDEDPWNNPQTKCEVLTAALRLAMPHLSAATLRACEVALRYAGSGAPLDLEQARKLLASPTDPEFPPPVENRKEGAAPKLTGTPVEGTLIPGTIHASKLGRMSVTMHFNSGQARGKVEISEGDFGPNFTVTAPGGVEYTGFLDMYEFANGKDPDGPYLQVVLDSPIDEPDSTHHTRIYPSGKVETFTE